MFETTADVFDYAKKVLSMCEEGIHKMNVHNIEITDINATVFIDLLSTIRFSSSMHNGNLSNLSEKEIIDDANLIFFDASIVDVIELVKKRYPDIKYLNSIQ